MRRLALIALLAVGCATSSDPTARRSSGGEVAEALALSHDPGKGPINAAGRPLALLVAQGSKSAAGNASPERRVLAVDLSSRQVLWNARAQVDGRLSISRSVAVYSRADGSLAALGLTGGADRWQFKPSRDAKLVGYATDADGVYAVYKGPVGNQPGSTGSHLVALDADSGSVRFRSPLAGRVGAPAARGGIVAVPQRSQFVTLIDGENGNVLADIVSREEAAKFVRALPEGFFFGSQGVFHASAETAMGSRKSSGYLQAKLPEFVRAVYHYDGYQPAQMRYSAIDRNRLLWRVQARNGKPEFAAGMVVVANFRFIFGVDAISGHLRWAYNHPRVDVAGASHVGRAIVFADVTGKVGAIDMADGRVMFHAPVQGAGGAPLTIVGATFDAEGFFSDGQGAQPAQPLVTVLKDMVLDPDRRFADVRLFAVDRLAQMRKPGVTGALLEILDKGREYDMVMQIASESLVNLQDPDALDVYVRAVKKRTDYAEGTKAQGLDLMARALAKLGARKVMVELVEHLRLPDTDPANVRDIADAVKALKATEVLPAFRDYLAQYRADSYFLNRPGGLIAAAEVLATLGGPEDRALLFFISEEEKTVGSLKTAVQRMLAETSGSPQVGPTATR